MVKRGGYFDPLPTAEEEMSLQRSTDGVSSRIQPRSASWNNASAQMDASSTVDVNSSSSSSSCQKPPAAEAVSTFNRVKAANTGKSGQAKSSRRRKRNPTSEEEEEEEEEDDDDDDDIVCGLGSYCSPGWLQPLASKQMFLAIFCLACVLQGMFYAYFVSVLTTIEKLFQIQSKTTGIIMSATEMGQIGGSLLLTYYVGQGHRPKWIGWGMVLFAGSSFLCSLPHFLFWRTKPPTTTATTSWSDGAGLPDASGLISPEVDSSFSAAQDRLQLNLVCRLQNKTSLIDEMNDQLDPSGGSGDHQCKSSSEQQAISRTTSWVLAIFFFSLLGIGMGRTAVETLGVPYIDDNVANRESATYIAIMIGVRIFGPVLGFALGSLCTSLYVDPFLDPDVTPKDPRWIGAWWLGMIFVSATIFLASFAMFAFPRRLAKKEDNNSDGWLNGAEKNDQDKTPEKSSVVAVAEVTSTVSNTSGGGGGGGGGCGGGSGNGASGASAGTGVAGHKNPSLKDFPKAVKRLLKNDILVFRTASSVLHILPVAGFYTFLPKYLESQFRLAAHVANMVSGIGGILVMGFGILFSGVYIRLMKPSPKFVAAWIALTALLYAIGMGILILMGCPINDFAGLTKTDSGMELSMTCNRTCECDEMTFAPICTSEAKTYFSPCHAGCSNLTHSGNQVGEIQYSNCECLGPGITATTGYCQLECNNFIMYVCIFSFFVLIHSTSEVGSMLLTLRCVHTKDKAMAMGLIQFAIGLFANVPCPIIYGAVVDSACFVWEKTCGEAGACWLYDPEKFRIFFHGTTGALMLAAFFVDVIVWYKADKISSLTDFPENPPSMEIEELAPMSSAPQ